jgi:hypothetical protein
MSLTVGAVSATDVLRPDSGLLIGQFGGAA